MFTEDFEISKQYRSFSQSCQNATSRPVIMRFAVSDDISVCFSIFFAFHFPLKKDDVKIVLSQETAGEKCIAYTCFLK